MFLMLPANSFRYLEIEHGFDIGGHVHGVAYILPYIFGIFKIYVGKVGHGTFIMSQSYEIIWIFSTWHRKTYANYRATNYNFSLV